MSSRPKSQRMRGAKVRKLKSGFRKPGKEKKQAIIKQQVETIPEHLNRLLSRAGFILCSLDGDGRVIFVNDGIEGITGYSARELIGRNWWRVFHSGRTSGEVKRLYQEFSSKRDINDYLMGIKVKDGSLKDFVWESHNEWDKDGRLCEINLTGYYVREGLIDRDLRDSFKHFFKVRGSILEFLKIYNSFSKIQDELKCWACLLDEKSRVLSWNRVAEKITGYTREEVLGSDKIWEWIYPDANYRSEVFRTGSALMKRGLINYESTITTKDGKRRVISWASNYLPAAKAGARAIFAMGLDITKQKELEARVRLREKMDGLMRIASHIAHDFNNIISIIQGYVELILERMDYNDPARDDLLEIVDAVERGSFLSNQLLAFSKTQIIEPIPLDINKLIIDMSQLLRRTLGEQIELNLNLNKNLPTVRADQIQMQQVILNLANNAREFMPDGGTFSISTGLSRIDTGADPFMKPGEYILLTVSDSGTGMSSELKERIFEPFASTKTEGFGFGLSMVYGIVNQHQGHIFVESEPGQGTVFQIYLPVSGEPVELPKPRKEAFELPKGNERILVVEDDDHMRLLAVRILRNLGYTVIETSNPKEALQFLEQYPDKVHLLLTDVEMPGMNGAELSERALKIRPELKTLYFSGYSLDYLVDKKILKPDAPLLTKPFSMRSISQKVREVLGMTK